MSYPTIIQGGMGVAVSGWPLANAVSKLGQLGVVSGTALDVVLARRLQLGDLAGHLRRAMAAFPRPDIVQQILADYFIAGGKAPEQPFRPVPVASVNPSPKHTWLVVLASFVETFLAKEGHKGGVGINFLEKIQLPTLAGLFGAMLAGVDYVLMGAGIPRLIPGILDGLSAGQAVKLKLDVAGASRDEEFISRLDPAALFEGEAPALKRPRFFPIVSSAVLAITLARKSSGTVDGFIVEGATAGGHNAPPRGPLQLNDRGEPIYGPRDAPEIDKIRALGLPFWMAGGYATPEKLAEARGLGAAGVQIGTPFAFCDESGVEKNLKRDVIRKSREGTLPVFTDPLASPTGFPFKVAQMEGSLSEKDIYENRKRVCDLGYLRQIYRKANGSVGYRCAGEPVAAYVAKGGCGTDTTGRACVCNGLLATIDLGQVRLSSGIHEPPLVTAGDDVQNVHRFLRKGQEGYNAADVIEFVLSEPGEPSN